MKARFEFPVPPRRERIKTAVFGAVIIIIGSAILAMTFLGGRAQPLGLVAGAGLFVSGGAWLMVASILPSTAPVSAEPPSRMRIALLVAEYLLCVLNLAGIAVLLAWITAQGNNSDFGSTRPNSLGLSEGAIGRALFGLGALLSAAACVWLGIKRAHRLRQVIEERRASTAGLQRPA
jgi:hypothetical protein